MEPNKTLTADQVEKLKETVRQRFDELYHRIGTNRQKLATTVLLVNQSINKELAKEKIDTAKEMEILRDLRDIEKMANNQLPHFHKVGATPTAGAKPPEIKPKVEPKPKPKLEAKPKPEAKQKPEAKPKPEVKPKVASKQKQKTAVTAKGKTKKKKK